MGFTDKEGDKESIYYTITDIQGSVTEVYDSDSKLVWKSGYTAFGIKAGETTSLLDFDGLYTGCDYDSETGLTYHWNRWRSEDGDSWLSEDSARDGVNWYGYAGQNPINFVDTDGQISLYAVLIANPKKMGRDESRSWIYKNIVMDSSIPVCKILYARGLLQNTADYDFSNETVVTKALSEADNYANQIIKQQVQGGNIKPKSTKLGETAFSPTKDTDLYGSFGGGCGFTWNVESINTETNEVKVKVYFEDTFDFNEGEKGDRNPLGEKLTAIGRKAEMSSYKISGYYYLTVSVNQDIAETINNELQGNEDTNDSK